MENNMKISKKIGILGLIIMLCATSFIIGVNANSASPIVNSTIEAGSMVQGADYVVFQSNSVINVKNGTSGAIDYKNILLPQFFELLNSTHQTGKVLIQDGTYQINNEINLTGIWLEGSHQAIIQKSSTFTGSFGILLNENSTLEGITFDGNMGNSGTSNGIELKNNSLMENCIVQNVRAYSINAYKCHDAKIINNIVLGTDQYGIVSTGQNGYWNKGILISGNTVSGFSQCDIKIRYTESSIITDNSLFVINGVGTSSTGIRLYQADYSNRMIIISNNAIQSINYATGGYASGIYSDVDTDLKNASFGSTIDGNTIRGMYYGIYYNGKALNIIGNTVLQCKYASIYATNNNGSEISSNFVNNIFLQNVKNASIEGNYVNGGSFGWAIRLITSNNISIMSNKVTNCSGNAIEFDSGNVDINLIYNDLTTNRGTLISGTPTRYNKIGNIYSGGVIT